jgi:hypothetical protein
MRQAVTTAARYRASIELIDEMKMIHGSYNKVSKALDMPWSTLAMVTSGRKPLPIAAVVRIAQTLARNPLIEIAKVEAEHTSGWIQKVWLDTLKNI